MEVQSALGVCGFLSAYSINFGSKVFWKKKTKARKFQKAKLATCSSYLHYIYNYLHSIYIVSDVISSYVVAVQS